MIRKVLHWFGLHTFGDWEEYVKLSVGFSSNQVSSSKSSIQMRKCVFCDEFQEQ